MREGPSEPAYPQLPAKLFRVIGERTIGTADEAATARDTGY
jgi:hypothetical protein